VPGKEKYEAFVECGTFTELQELIDFLSESKEQVFHNGRYWKVRLVLTPDLPAGCEIFGFSHYFAPASKDTKCFYCAKGINEFSDFKEGDFSFRTFEDIELCGKQALKSGQAVRGVEVCIKSVFFLA
jgi:hypothetical protein